jgi:hypothetical protein
MLLMHNNVPGGVLQVEGCTPRLEAGWVVGLALEAWGRGLGGLLLLGRAESQREQTTDRLAKPQTSNSPNSSSGCPENAAEDEEDNGEGEGTGNRERGLGNAVVLSHVIERCDPALSFPLTDGLTATKDRPAAKNHIHILGVGGGSFVYGDWRRFEKHFDDVMMC